VNTPTLIASLIMAVVIVLLIAFLIRQMLRGWLHRAQRQADMIGTLPPLPDTVSAASVAATKGLYVGTTLVPHWNDKVAAGDLGYRAKAVLTRYPEGLMLQRIGAGPIWIPQESITAIRTERGIAGKVIPGGRSAATRGKAQSHDGILAIRWKLPSGTEIDTGFRADNRAEYDRWLEEKA
jgi:hypothetical protein